MYKINDYLWKGIIEDKEFDKNFETEVDLITDKSYNAVVSSKI